jgi:hypothetical protein
VASLLLLVVVVVVLVRGLTMWMLAAAPAAGGRVWRGQPLDPHLLRQLLLCALLLMAEAFPKAG